MLATAAAAETARKQAEAEEAARKKAEAERLAAHIKASVANALKEQFFPTETVYDDSTGTFSEKLVNEFGEFY